MVFRLVKDFPNFKFTLNGGVKSLTEAKTLLDAGVYGVMVGRAIPHSPWEWRQVDSILFGEVCLVTYVCATCLAVFSMFFI